MEILGMIILFLVVVDIIGTIRNAFMIRENRKMAIKNKKRSKNNEAAIKNT